MMDKAVIVGGTSGIGLAIAKELMRRGYHAVILGRRDPGEAIAKETLAGQCTYIYCDLLDFDEELIERLAADRDISILMITAGSGRVADFEYLHPAEIHSLMSVNAEAAIKIIRYFYSRIESDEDFYTGVMGSIAGMMSSPMFSVYAASKAAVYRFIESVNIELEVKGSPNRILNCSPGSIKGTRFNGEEQDLSLLEGLSESVVEKLFERAALYIPDEDVYGPVLMRYHEDPHGYGIYSYNYKRDSGRAFNENRVRIGYLSGTFDLFHVGHLNLLKRAKENCDYLIVGVHESGAWKGKETFIPFEERKRIVASCRYVDRVVDSMPEDSDAVIKYGANRLFVGSDYRGTERFKRYEELLRDKGVEIIYFPYTEGTNSTKIRNAILGSSRGSP